MCRPWVWTSRTSEMCPDAVGSSRQLVMRCAAHNAPYVTRCGPAFPAPINDRPWILLPTHETIDQVHGCPATDVNLKLRVSVLDSGSIWWHFDVEEFRFDEICLDYIISKMRNFWIGLYKMIVVCIVWHI